MARFDRYMLSQLLLFFGFFALVLVAIFWISRAVGLFDRLIGDGQSLWVFLEFTVLGLPGLIILVLPLSAFAAAVFVTNRLTSESEMTVMIATGSSPWRLARPVVVFGLSVAVMMSILAHVLVPMALGELTLREREVSQDVTSGLLTEGTFLHPSAGVTLYTRAIGEDGVLRDVFLSDRRDPENRTIFTASEAYLVRQDDQTSLIMVDGLAQRLDGTSLRLATGTFRDFSYDISSLVPDSASLVRNARTMVTPELLAEWAADDRAVHNSHGVMTEEFHSRFAQPLFALVAGLIGFAVLISRGYSRFGAWREVLLAFGLLLLLDALRAFIADTVRGGQGGWPLMYLPPLVGAAIVAGLLQNSARPLRLRRRMAA